MKNIAENLYWCVLAVGWLTALILDIRWLIVLVGSLAVFDRLWMVFAKDWGLGRKDRNDPPASQEQWSCERVAAASFLQGQKSMGLALKPCEE